MSIKDTKYSKLLKYQIISSLRSKTNSLEDICRSCKGAFPTDVVETIKHLKLDKEVDFSITEKKKRNLFKIEESPIDFEWRFTKETAKNISEIALEFGDKILCLGTPTIFKELFKAKAETFLIDRNPFLKEMFPKAAEENILISDIGKLKKHKFSKSFNVVVIDPPWYLSHTLFWIYVASKFLDREGVIIIPIFPELVRPSATEERKYLFKTLKKFGEVQQTSQCIYHTPLFEHKTLSNLGILGVESWRTTDLFILKSKKSFDVFPEPPKDKEWHRFRFGTQIVGIKNSNEYNQTISIKSPYKDSSFLLKSVSARDFTHSKISLWTSRNKVAILTGIERILEFIKMLQEGKSQDYAINKVAKNKKESQELEKLIILISINS